MGRKTNAEDRDKRIKDEAERKRKLAEAEKAESDRKTAETANNTELEKIFKDEYIELAMNKFPKVSTPATVEGKDNQGCIKVDDQLACAKKCLETNDCHEVWMNLDSSQQKGRCC